MVAKRSLRALALLLALPSAALALGLGDIRLLSPLNAPLDAEVDLVDVAPDEANTVQAQLASRETFARYGLDWPAYLAGVQVRTVRAPAARRAGSRWTAGSGARRCRQAPAGRQGPAQILPAPAASWLPSPRRTRAPSKRT